MKTSGLRKLFSPVRLATTAATAMLALTSVKALAETYYVSTWSMCGYNPCSGGELCDYPFKKYCYNGTPPFATRYWCCANEDGCGYYHSDDQTGDCHPPG